MREALSITISVFVKSEEPEEHNNRCIEAIKALSGLDLEKEKLQVVTESVEGFNNRKIKIHSLKIVKESYTNNCLNHILSALTSDQIALLQSQKESRLDEEFNFFIRLGKEELLRKELLITDSGDCFHIRIVIAAYPKKKESAIVVLDKLFDKYLNITSQRQ
jgi:RNA binding exosome subunit